MSSLIIVTFNTLFLDFRYLYKVKLLVFNFRKDLVKHYI